jgi:hypothetical protein
MGRIADEQQPEPDAASAWTNRVDDVLEQLDDDDDRAVVLGWLMSSVSAADIMFRLDAYGIRLSDKSVQQWRRAQKLGRGRVWES